MTQQDSKGVQVLVRAAVGIGLLIFVMTRIDLGDAAQIVLQADPLLLVSAIGLFLGMFLVKTIRWRMLLRSQRFSFSFRDALFTYLLSSLAGSVSPARAGEMLRVLPPAQEDLRYAESLACAGIDKAYDVALLGILLLVGSLAPLVSSGESMTLGLMGACILIALATMPFLLRRWLTHGAQMPDWALNVAPASWRSHITGQPRRFIQASYDCLARCWSASLALTVAFWVIHVLCHYCMLRAVGGELNLYYFVLCLILVGLVEFAPISICGFGARELLLVYLFERGEVLRETAFAFASLNLVLMYAITGLFTLGAWLWARQKQGGADEPG